ncbi:hypothetical protein MPUL_31720 [Mycolicibacterium pulveris]|uniref:Uncharacterized protein n=1 Tax=Mycolicibacterium pulveris TaxID=36813 RepID=A0A7I7UKN0_MYCPV|nr:hypothetical protein MPUL_31720 [Mycolicibacterium pulveris]
MKTYRLHRCDRNHKQHDAFMRCAYPKAAISGEGQFAVISRCTRPHVITLYTNPAAAQEDVDALVCDGLCVFDHEVVHLDLNHQQNWKHTHV